MEYGLIQTMTWNTIKLLLLQLFHGSLDFVWDYSSKPVPEK